MARTELIRLRADVGDLLEAREARGTAADFTAYASDPVGFIRDVLGEKKPGLWSAQVEIAEAVRDHPLVVVRSNNSMGKDWLAARLALWWVYACEGLALVTGPTERQVRGIIMREVHRSFHRTRRLHGQMFQMALKLGDGEDRGILAFTSSDASRLTGFHAPKIMVLMTEGQGVEDFAYEAMLSCATGSSDRILVLGNPLVPSGRFYTVNRSSDWHAIQVSAEEHPNVVEGRELIPGAVTRAFVARMASEYGEGSSIYRSRVLGEFPDQGEEALFSRALLETGADRWEDPAWWAKAIGAPPIVAVDPARYGPDSTLAAIRRGPLIEKFVEWRNASTMETVARIERVAASAGVRPARPASTFEPGAHGRIVVDTVGLGAGVADRLKELNYTVIEYNGGHAVSGGRFLNVRARSYWHLRDLLEQGRVAIPRDETLFEELLALRWKPTTDNRVQMEAKQDLKGRLGRSPDRSDALVMALDAPFMTIRVGKLIR